VRAAAKKLAPFVRPDDERATEFVGFANRWAHSGFARLEVGHKLAAALALTDVPEEIEVKAPWPAWSLVLPDGLFGPMCEREDTGELYGPSEPARVWIEETTRTFVVWRNGDAYPCKRPPGTEAVSHTLTNLIRGACLALSNPDDFRKENQHGPTARSHKSNRHGPPDLQQARFLLSAPVKVDLREHLRGVLSGRKGASPTVQFLVRGHWRNQAHGPKNTLRKTMWIQPFWKGPEESRILLRQHRVEGP
jgi:hypothetical protein